MANNNYPFSRLTAAQVQRVQNTGIPLNIDGSKGGHVFTAAENGRTVICTNTPALSFPLGLGDGFQVPIMGAFTVTGSGAAGMAVINDPRSSSGDANSSVTVRQAAQGVYNIVAGGTSYTDAQALAAAKAGIPASNLPQAAVTVLQAKGTPTLRCVATRCANPNGGQAGRAAFQSKTVHRLRAPVSAIGVVLANWGTNSATAENGSGGSATFTASAENIEQGDPGTRVQILFGGAAAGTTADYTSLQSDLSAFSGKAGDKINIRVNGTFASGNLIAAAGAGYNTNLDLSTYGVSTTADTTMAGDPPNGGVFLPPLVIIGMSSDPAVLITGDSTGAGTLDTVDINGAMGLFSRSIEPYFAYSNMALDSERLYRDLTLGQKMVRRVEAAKYFTHFINGNGINDLGDGQTVAQLLANHATLNQMVKVANPNILCFNTTLPPRSICTKSLTSLTRSGTVATATLAAGTAGGTLPKVGSPISIYGATPTGFNGIGLVGGSTFVVLSVNATANTFTFNIAADPGSDATGTLTWDDQFASVENQTPMGTNTLRSQYNDALRNNVQPYADGFIDIADALEPYRNAGVWVANGRPGFSSQGGYAGDGTHATQAGYLLVKRAGVVLQGLGLSKA